MKTKISKIALLLFAVITLVSCSNDDDETAGPKIYAEENPLSAYLQNSGFNEATTNFINAGSYEFGYKFSPKVKGKINAITFKIPDNATNTRVTIWDNVTKTVLKTVTIPTSTANVETTFAIDPFMLEANKEYMITYNGNDWYKRNKLNNSVTTYPITAGNISILGYQWLGGTTQTYPTSVSNDYYAGDLSIVFQQVD